MPPAPATPRAVVGLLLVAGAVGVVVSLAAWGFLELVHQVQTGVYDDLPKKLGYDDGAPLWWPLPVLAISGVAVALAIERLPGRGGHNPAEGLKTAVTTPVELPGVMLAAIATIGLGVVLGPEAPLIALGSALGLLAVKLARADAPEPLRALVAGAGSFAAISFIFGSPLIGAVILIEAAGLDRRRLQVVLPVGLLAAGVGSLVSIGMGQWTGLSSKDYALAPLSLPSFDRPDVTDFAWTVPFAAVVAIGCIVVFRLARAIQPVLGRRPLFLLPVAALAIGGLAIAFAETTDKASSEVLFSGQEALPDVVGGASSWSVTALALLLLFKGLAWSVSLAGFRGGPTFPGLLIGAAAGVLASHLPGFAITPAVAVGMGAAIAAVLELPLAAVVLATLLTTGAGPGVGPLIIVGVVVAFVVTRAVHARAGDAEPDAAPEPPVAVTA
jgi:H+/Cl- antiporter ClcA